MTKSTRIYTLFTDATGVAKDIFSAESWSRIRLTLETAGPVAVGTSHDLGDVLSGQGVLLTTNEPITWDLQKGDRLYWVAESINRVKFSVESIAYGDEYAQTLKEIRDAELGVKSSIVAATPIPMRQAPKQDKIIMPKLGLKLPR